MSIISSTELAYVQWSIPFNHFQFPLQFIAVPFIQFQFNLFQFILLNPIKFLTIFFSIPIKFLSIQFFSIPSIIIQFKSNSHSNSLQFLLFNSNSICFNSFFKIQLNLLQFFFLFQFNFFQFNFFQFHL